MSVNQEFHSGGEGIVVAAGIDWNVMQWEGTETTEDQETTNTSDFDANEKVSFRNQWPTKRHFEGTFNFDWDALNPPIHTTAAEIAEGLNKDLRSGMQIPVILKKPNGRQIRFPKALITSTPITSGGTGGLFHTTINFKNAGKYYWE